MDKPILLPNRQVNQEWLAGLVIEDVKQYPLPGAYGTRQARPDERLSHLTPKYADKVCYYMHVATIQHKPTGLFFVAFRETMDALLAAQSDPAKFPEWLMKHPVKKTELSVFIYRVKCKPTENMHGHEDWLEYIAEPWIQDTLAYFLLQSGVFTQEMYGHMK